MRVLGININSMSFWSKDNYKAERLKFISKKYVVDIAGLQEVYMNWSDFKSSQTLASNPRFKEKNRPVASHDERETKILTDTKGERGGIATILREQLPASVIDS